MILNQFKMNFDTCGFIIFQNSQNTKIRHQDPAKHTFGQKNAKFSRAREVSGYHEGSFGITWCEALSFRIGPGAQ